MHTAKIAVYQVQAEDGVALTGPEYRELLTLASDVVLATADLDQAKYAVRCALAGNNPIMEAL